jgi:drug/metabolite transporter (DMT)-like permease
MCPAAPAAAVTPLTPYYLTRHHRLPRRRSLRLLAVPMVTIFKNLTNVLILGGDWYWFSQPVSPKVLLSLGLTILGAVAAAGVDTRFSASGYAWMAANCAATAGYVLYMRSVTRTTKLTEFGGSLYNNVLALPLTAAAALASGDFPGVLRMPQWSSPGFVLALLLSGVIGFALSICSLWCMKATSASTYAIIGALNKVPLAAIGVLAFADPLTLKLALYIALGLGAGVMYAMAKVRGCFRDARGFVARMRLCVCESLVVTVVAALLVRVRATRARKRLGVRLGLLDPVVVVCARTRACLPRPTRRRCVCAARAQVEEREALRAKERATENLRERAADLERAVGRGGSGAGGESEEDAATRRPLAAPHTAQA